MDNTTKTQNESSSKILLSLIFINTLVIICILGFFGYKLNKSDYQLGYTSTQKINNNVITEMVIPESPFSDLPDFLEGVSKDYVLSDTEVKQLLNNQIFSKYKNDPRLKLLIENAKKDSILKYDEYQSIISTLKTIYEDDNYQSSIQKSKKWVNDL